MKNDIYQQQPTDEDTIQLFEKIAEILKMITTVKRTSLYTINPLLLNIYNVFIENKILSNIQKLYEYKNYDLTIMDYYQIIYATLCQLETKKIIKNIEPAYSLSIMNSRATYYNMNPDIIDPLDTIDINMWFSYYINPSVLLDGYGGGYSKLLYGNSTQYDTNRYSQTQCRYSITYTATKIENKSTKFKRYIIN